MPAAAPIRVVLAKVGLDGHDRGVKVVARGLRDAGLHVIYAGLWQSPEAVVGAVADEDADFLGLSILSGAHMTLVPHVLERLHEAGLADVGVLVGGIIPGDDIPRLMDLGVVRVFGPGTSIEEIAGFLRDRSGAFPFEHLVKRFQKHDRLALARLLSLAATGEELDLVNQALEASDHRARVIAITGSGGVGK